MSNMKLCRDGVIRDLDSPATSPFPDDSNTWPVEWGVRMKPPCRRKIYFIQAVNGQWFTGRIAGKYRWISDFSKARVFQRRCDASSSLNAVFGQVGARVVEVAVTLADWQQ